MAKTFTREEVGAHRTKDDLWIVVHNKVYNVSDYREDHPGGAELLIEVGGLDATQAFEDVGHSDEAREFIESLLIGELAADEAHEAVETYRPRFEVVSTTNEFRAIKTGSSMLVKATAVSVAVLGAGAGLYFGRTAKATPTISFDHFRGLFSSGQATTSGGFWKGFTAAAIVNSFLAVFGTRYIKEVLDVNKSHKSYPAYKTSTTEIFTTRRKVLVEPVLHPQQYRKFPLIRKDFLSHNVYRFVFGLSKPSDVLGLPTGQHVAIRAEIDGKTVSRSYTPTSNNTNLGHMELVIKVYPGGLISNYLAALKPHDLVEFRGPKGAMKYHRDLCKNLCMIAGGTGITPMFQVIRAICEDPKDNTKVTLLYGNQTEDDILLREELDGFHRQFPHKFSVWYVLEKAPTGWQYGTGFVTKDFIMEKFVAPSPDSKVHVCGPPGMINAMKKTLVQLGFEAPSPISKAADQVFLY